MILPRFEGAHCSLWKATINMFKNSLWDNLILGTSRWLWTTHWWGHKTFTQSWAQWLQTQLEHCWPGDTCSNTGLRSGRSFTPDPSPWATSSNLLLVTSQQNLTIQRWENPNQSLNFWQNIVGKKIFWQKRCRGRSFGLEANFGGNSNKYKI